MFRDIWIWLFWEIWFAEGFMSWSQAKHDFSLEDNGEKNWFEFNKYGRPKHEVRTISLSPSSKYVVFFSSLSLHLIRVLSFPIPIHTLTHAHNESLLMLAAHFCTHKRREKVMSVNATINQCHTENQSNVCTTLSLLPHELRCCPFWLVAFVCVHT